MCWPFSSLKTLRTPHGLVEGTQVLVCHWWMWFDLPDSPAQLAFLLFHFQFNTNLGTCSLCWVTRTQSIKVLFEVIHPKEPQPSPRSGWFSWNCTECCWVGPFLYFLRKFSKAASLPCALPSGTPDPPKVTCSRPWEPGLTDRASCVHLQSQDTQG